MTMRTGSPLRACVAVAGCTVLLLGCEHSQPFEHDPPWTERPHEPGLPSRLTYSAFDDVAPSWAPDGRAIVYTVTRSDGGTTPRGERDADRCVAFLPPAGGQIYRQLCVNVAYSGRTDDAQQEPALGTNGHLAFVRSSMPHAWVPFGGAELVVTDSLGRHRRRLHPLPARASNGAWYHHASRLRWLDASRLLYVAEHIACTNRCEEIVRRGVGVIEVTLASDPASVELLAGTEGATSFAPGEAGDLYLTRVNDSRVYRRTADGTVTAVWDAGAGSIARDVVYRDQHLLVVAGGVVELVDDPFDDPDRGVGHIDGGGILHAVDLADGTAEVVPLGDMLVRRPALSPGGGRVVVEAVGPDGTDLWLLELPG